MSDTAYQRWSAGHCPCCGWMDADDTWEWQGEVYEPRAIGEGVMICGRCVGNDHDEEPLIRAILESLILRHDGPIEEAVANVRTGWPR